MKKRLVILGNSSSNHIIRWARGVALSGFDVIVISCGGSNIDGIDTIVLGEEMGGAKNYLRHIRHARGKIRQLNPALIHVFQATGYALWGSLKIDCPKLLTPLGSDITLSSQRGFLYRRYVDYVLRGYDHFTTVSSFLKRELNSLYPITEGRTSIIPFGVELPAALKVHKERSPVRLVFMKHFLPVYGPHVLLKAIRIIKDRDVSIELDMYGSNDRSKWVKEIADELGISPMVTFKGWLDMDLIMAKLLDYDLMVMPSLSESFGVAALEASAVGLPVIATTIGGIPEIVEDDVTGILVPPNDPKSLAEAIIKLASDVKLRRKMGEAGRKRALENFRWEDNLKEMIRLYKQLIEKKSLR